jgi:hypothetical protein
MQNKDFGQNIKKKLLSKITVYMDIENEEFLLFLKCIRVA